MARAAFLEAEAVTAVVAITAGLLLSQYAQAVIDCDGDPDALRVYLCRLPMDVR